jgi:beta-phosphoglucomutase-like phosphatase (HAD superfamily)
MDPTGPAALKRLKQFGFDVVVLTARPLWTYPRMLLETVRWLNTNCIPFDGVILSVQKPHYVGQGIIIEDNSDNVRALLKGGAYVYVVNRPYNQDLPPHPQMIRVSSLNEAAREIIELTERLK